MVTKAVLDLDNVLGERMAKFELERFVNSSPKTFTQEDFEALEYRVNGHRNRMINKKKLYLHYSFRDIAHIFQTGTGLKVPSWATRTVYPTGWHAKYYLALYTRGPRNAIYIVLPQSQDMVHYGRVAGGRTDQYPPTAGTWLKGGGQQWYFPNGTSPGTVFGPIPIPKGSLSDI